MPGGLIRRCPSTWARHPPLSEPKVHAGGEAHPAGADLRRPASNSFETNHEQDNWLQIETFDPHEPFFTLKQWKDRYNYDWPHLGRNYARVTEDRMPWSTALQRGL